MKKILVGVILTVLFLLGCGRTSQIDKIISDAESIIMEHPDSAMEMLDKVERVLLKEGKQKAKFSLLYAMAMTKNYIDSQSDSLTSVALEYYRDNGTDREKALAYYYHGLTMYNASLEVEAIKFFLQAKMCAERTDDHYTKGLVYHVIAECYFLQHSRNEALEYHLKALEEYRQTENILNVSIAIRNVGMMYRYLGRYEEAIPYLLEAKQMALDLNETMRYLNLSITLENIGYYKSVQSSITEEWYEIFRNEEDSTKYNSAMAYYYVRLNKLDSALFYYKKSYDNETHFTIYTVTELSKMSKLSEELGDLESALMYERRYRHHTDSLYKINLANVAQEAEHKSRSKYYEDSYTILRSRHIYMVVTYSLIFLITLLFVVLIIRKYRRVMKRRADEIQEYYEYLQVTLEQKTELEHRCDELEKSIVSGNNNSGERMLVLLRNRVTELRKLTQSAHLHESDTIKFYDSFKTLLKMNANNQSDFVNELCEISDLSCNGVITYLRTNFHTLTNYELSYCALIIMGFTQESIRVLMNHTNINSVYTLRARIRRKIQLPSGESTLESHLQQLVEQLSPEKH